MVQQSCQRLDDFYGGISGGCAAAPERHRECSSRDEREHSCCCDPLSPSLLCRQHSSREELKRLTDASGGPVDLVADNVGVHGLNSKGRALVAYKPPTR